MYNPFIRNTQGMKISLLIFTYIQLLLLYSFMVCIHLKIVGDDFTHSKKNDSSNTTQIIRIVSTRFERIISIVLSMSLQIST